MNSALQEKISPFFIHEPSVKLAYLFGSQAVGNAGPTSDYDFAIYLDSKDPKKLFEVKAHLLDKLSLLLKSDNIDIVLLDSAKKPELKYAIITKGVLLKEVEPYRVLVEPQILNEYFDFKMCLEKNKVH
ncbi:nucleotidyltransferase domain-containing protein [Patescibacteria group bacterium]|nr:nucleotidyltransferase domain-containing protein [Patescibacteria group bacterium]